MISGAQIVVLVVVAVALYLIFYVITMPAQLRNILGIIFAIVLFALVINLMVGAFPF